MHDTFRLSYPAARVRLTLLLLLGPLAAALPFPARVAAQPTPLNVQSPAFQEGGAIPLRHSAYGENVSPPISWSGAPAETRSFVLIMHDRDYPVPGGFVHMVVYNIPGSVTGLPEGLTGGPILTDPPAWAGTTLGVTGMRNLGYYGPRPQPGSGPHHYVFTVYALSRAPDLEPGLGRDQVLSQVRDQVIGQGIAVGTYTQN